MHVLLTIYEIALANIYTEYLILGMSPCIAKIELQVEQKHKYLHPTISVYSGDCVVHVIQLHVCSFSALSYDVLITISA